MESRQQKFIFNKKLLFFGLVALTFALITFSFIYKLDYHYFFTDEILNVNRGLEHINGIYSDDAHVPILSKYFSGVVYFLFSNNVFFLRLPYALIGVLTSFVVFLIVKREFGYGFGLLAAVFFASSKIIFDSSRMVMLEPLMHLFWVVFLYYFYTAIKTLDAKYFLLAGVFFGLSLDTKVTSIVLVPFTLVMGLVLLSTRLTRFTGIKKVFKNFFLMYGLGTLVLLGTYTHYFLTLGMKEGLFNIFRAIKDVYITKSSEGKTHVIAGQVYSHSPYWSYLHFFVKENTLFRGVVYLVTAPFAFAKDRLFGVYWGTFLLIILVFMQFSGVKNVRYVSSIEIPLIILSVSGLYYLYGFIKFKLTAKPKCRKAFLGGFWVFILAVVFTSVAFHFNYLKNLEKTKYLGLYEFFKAETRDFSEYQRMYVFGSVRSMKWYRSQVPNKHMLLYRVDHEAVCPDFDLFKYIAFEKDHLVKKPNNLLYQFVMENTGSFIKKDVAGMLLFERKVDSDVVFECPKLFYE